MSCKYPERPCPYRRIFTIRGKQVVFCFFRFEVCECKRIHCRYLEKIEVFREPPRNTEIIPLGCSIECIYDLPENCPYRKLLKNVTHVKKSE